MDAEIITKDREVVRLKNLTIERSGLAYLFSGESLDYPGKIFTIRLDATQVDIECIGPEESPEDIVRMTVHKE